MRRTASISPGFRTSRVAPKDSFGAALPQEDVQRNTHKTIHLLPTSSAHKESLWVALREVNYRNRVACQS
ncbi:hypothetical protein CA54_35170 [Symmachiella macrocystis]|uniref:Uncharacterized protein n=1 Tax=Symmachiella macrocystis TaxID=2527985 RepID=A0A5C6BRH2_9PLAN|nr:hypothetical protein CA54_35170 [Symmachiella macrocystis]